jgi:hypothetical protein
MSRNNLVAPCVKNVPHMSRSLSVAIVPVSAEDIARRSYEQRYLIEDRIVYSLIEIINQGIQDQVLHGMLDYEFCIPSFIYGFPKFDVQYVGRKLRGLYAGRGFRVQGAGRWAKLEWTQQHREQPPPLRTTTTTTTTTTTRSSSGRAAAPTRKRAPLLPPSSS